MNNNAQIDDILSASASLDLMNKFWGSKNSLSNSHTFYFFTWNETAR